MNLWTKSSQGPVPQRAQTVGKHQECGLNDQKGTACRCHDEQMFVSKRFKAMEPVEEMRKSTKPKEVEEGPPNFTKERKMTTNFPKRVPLSCWYTGTLQDGSL
ncbi:peptidyl-prolyl cis-trans isomerase FKBP3-like [Stigmatopora argus]